MVGVRQDPKPPNGRAFSCLPANRWAISCPPANRQAFPYPPDSWQAPFCPVDRRVSSLNPTVRHQAHKTLRVLGSAAGGGFPQWNCNCFNCDGLRRGVIAASARTQSSIALSEDGVHWLLVNASPDILAQIRATPALQPARAARDTGIVAVLLVDAQIDHAAGLLMLREHRSALPVYATPAVLQDLAEGFPLTRILSHYCRLQ